MKIGALSLLAACSLGSALAAGCASTNLGLGPPPTVVEVAPAPQPASVRTPSGLTWVSDPTAPGEFVAALLFRGGPINDPPTLPGLTEWMVEAALLGTRGYDPVTASPHERALALGGTLEPVANGALAGWMVFGPRDSAEALLKLLHDVALSPSFPATRLSMTIAMNREALETREDALIERAIAIALGQSLGLGRPLYMGPTAGTFERVTLAHTERQWRRIVRPEHGVLVVLGGPGREALEKDGPGHPWPEAPPRSADRPTTCVPQGRTAHLLVTPGSFGEHTIALWGSRAPGWGLEGRRATDALMLHLDDRQGGPMETLVGASQARRASPDVVDLGHIGGRPLAALLVGAAGPPERALVDLGRVDRFLSSLGEEDAVNEAEAQRARIRLERRDRFRLHRPFHNVMQLAARALAPPRTEPVTRDAMNRAARELFAPWKSNLVLVGSLDLRDALEEEAPVALWPADDGLAAPENPVRCVRGGGAP